MAGTKAANKRVINNFFKNFGSQVVQDTKQTVNDMILREVELYAQNIVYKAIEFRKKAPGAHDFTGNLLNSIVAAVYQDKGFKKAFFAGETGIKSPRYYEMTASHNGNGHYHFKIDYEGGESNYTAEIETLRRKGIDDAYEFVSTYVPDRDDFLVIIAYTTEYATFVEMERETTGFVSTFAYAKKLGIRKFRLTGKS